VHYIAQVKGDKMDKINRIMSENIKSLRKKKNLSLDQLAKLSSVSKSMLGQIERGETNPTINTIWKISNGMKVSFSQLVRKQTEGTQVVKSTQDECFSSDSGRYKLWSIFPYDEAKGFEIYRNEIEKGGSLEAEPHGIGTTEYITVFQGELEIRVGEESYIITQGQSIKFDANKYHAYSNQKSEKIQMSMIIYYNKV
jgi:XRE family transcriptional regulator, regulator of sulfur utilization